MNLKTFSTGLALSALGVLSLATQADAFSFNFLGSAAAGGGQTTYQFGFTAAPGEVIAAGQGLTVGGFEGISSISLTDPVNNVASTLFSNSVFEIIGNGISNNATTANFRTLADISNFTGFVRYETFTVTATDVPTGEVIADFGGTPLPPTAVPEPLTLLGALTAAGFGAAFKRRSLKSVE
jgi:hypothetical protein